ncbi:MAG: hypothetical protein EA341_17750 [Mongoliibacter sp.]|nr:MAG: hypothetical protein EA341_17750 [Mongoliibacter sp.]
MQIKKSCQKQDSFQNINPNITLEIKSFMYKLLDTKLFGGNCSYFFFNNVTYQNILYVFKMKSKINRFMSYLQIEK